MNASRPKSAINFRSLYILTGCIVLAVAALTAADPQEPAGKADKTPERRDAKAALAEFNSIIGDWRGTGQPKRGSQSGAWSETANWVWHFEKGVPTIHYHVDKGKMLNSAVLGWDDEKQTYHLHAHFSEGKERDYTGKLADTKLVVDSEPDTDGIVHRLTLTQLNPKRTVVLIEKRAKDSTFFNRVAEVGYTRQGTSIAESGSNEPECIVTGGKGTMTVSYKGQTYYVCCTGCKAAFDDDPEGIIADYKMRLAEKAAKSKSP